jgi:hypothetical protein
MSEVMIIGVYHLGETSDLTKVEQKNRYDLEIESKEVVEALSQFNPTKLAVEAVCEEQTDLNENYRNYQLNNFKQRTNEIELIGFPLAKQMGISEISCIDWMEDENEYAELGDILQYAKEHENERYNHMMKKYIEPMKLQSEELSTISILEGYKRLNNIETVKQMHEVYMELAMIGKEKNYYGIDWLTWWYKRNLIIYTNLRRVITDPKDRVLLLIGSGHVHLIKQFLEESGTCKIIDANEYLK